MIDRKKFRSLKVGDKVNIFKKRNSTDDSVHVVGDYNGIDGGGLKISRTGTICTKTPRLIVVEVDPLQRGRETYREAFNIWETDKLIGRRF